MRKIYIAMVCAISALAQPVFAGDHDMVLSDSKPCMVVADACEKAGFNSADPAKMFWLSCMKPILLGNTVQGVTVDADAVIACRDKKIAELKLELSELEKATATAQK